MKPEQLLTVEPEVLVDHAERLEMFADVREVEQLLEASRVSPENHLLPQHLREAAEVVDPRVPVEPIQSHRPLIGPLIVASKRLFRAGFQPFINELLRTQQKYNERILGALSLLHEQLERQGAQDRRWRAEVDKRLDSLERSEPPHEREGP